MNLDLQSVSDSDLRAEYRRREAAELKFTWAVNLMRDYAVWESETGRARKITDWHARQIAERLCTALGITRQEFAARIVADHEASGKPR
jgi:hypothetical protein